MAMETEEEISESCPFDEGKAMLWSIANWATLGPASGIASLTLGAMVAIRNPEWGLEIAKWIANVNEDDANAMEKEVLEVYRLIKK